MDGRSQRRGPLSSTDLTFSQSNSFSSLLLHRCLGTWTLRCAAVAQHSTLTAKWEVSVYPFWGEGLMLVKRLLGLSFGLMVVIGLVGCGGGSGARVEPAASPPSTMQGLEQPGDLEGGADAALPPDQRVEN
jgi:hypothetical protein